MIKKISTFFLFPLTNIIIGIFLVSGFLMAGQNIAQTFRVASMAALAYLRPPSDYYFWDINLHQAAIDPNKIYTYVDYYEQLLKDFPGAREGYGLLGYCYHYLGNDPKAIAYLERANAASPGYFWNYYNLAAIDINEGRYEQGAELLQQAVQINPQASLKKLVTSPLVYAPLLKLDKKEDFVETEDHLARAYKSCIALLQIINQSQGNPAMMQQLQKMRLELYAF